MLEKIVIENYKGFKNYEINFSNENILVGKNNAGKSTIGEVIRVVSLATNSYKNAIFISRPEWLYKEPLIEKGFSPSTKRIKINLNNCIHKYEEEIAKITAIFKNKTKIKIFINYNGEIFIKIYESNKCINTRYKIAVMNIPLVKSLPSLKPLLLEEKKHDEQYVMAPYNERNLSIHFRNRLYIDKKYRVYEKFCDSVATTWPGIRISDLYMDDNIIRLNVIDEDFATEISNFGDGLQIWMQMLWFIASQNENTIVFFDEPDVYLHAELQKKLFKYISNKFQQFVIATHSIEIICCANNNSVIEIDKRKNTSERILDRDDVQNILENLGSYANIKIQSILNSKKLVFVEGNDINWLKQIASRLFDKPYELVDIPYEKSGGRSNIKEKMLSLSNDIEEMKNSGIKLFFLTDNDYFNDLDNQELASLANNIKVNLHIWKRKEFENYFCDLCLLSSLLNEQIAENEIKNILISITDNMKDDYLYKRVDLEYKKNKKLEVSTIMKNIKSEVEEKWEHLDYRLNILSGKQILKRVFDKLKKEYNISLSIEYIIKNMAIDCLDREVIEYIKELYN